jgi:endoribonuclease Dicer
MVSNSVLAAICVWSGLYKHLIYESYVLAKSIREYVIKLEAKQAAEYEAAEREGRAPGQYWLDIEPPKVRRSSSTRDAIHSPVLCRRCQTWLNR